MRTLLGSRIVSLTVLACLWLFIPTAAHAAGGPCPSGNIQNLNVSLSSQGVTSCFHVSAAGADTNTGLSEAAPWKHAPGMTGCTSNCSGTTLAAGEGIIFRGGDTYHYTASTNTSTDTPLSGSWAWTHSGSSGSPYYIGVDRTWTTAGTGQPVGNFVRPIFTMDNAPTTSQPASCPTAADDGNNLVNLGSQSFIIVDNLEFTGACNNAGSGGGYLVHSGAANLTIVNNYFHGLTGTTNYTSDTFTFSHGNRNNTTNITTRVAYNVFDNSDGSFGNRFTQPHVTSCGSPPFTNSGVNCATTTGTPVANNVGAIGWALDEGNTVDHNVFRHVSNGMEGGDFITVDDNLLEYIFSPLNNSPHGNVAEWLGGVPSTPCYIFNNVVRNVSDGVTFWPQCDTGYFYNNVMENDWHNGGAANATFFSPTGLSNVGEVTNWTYCNNTADNTIYFEAIQGNGSTPHWASGSTATFCNMHILDRTVLNGSFFQVITPSVASVTDLGVEKFQTTSAANAQGYQLSNDFQPTSTGGITYHAGNNETSLSGPTPDLQSGTSNGCTEASGSGGQVVSCPAITVNARGSTWDVGAYQFSPASASFTCSPGTIPSNHSGHISLTCTGSGTSWNGSTNFTVSGVTGTSLFSSTNNSATSQTLVVTTGAGTGTLTINDTTDSLSTTINVSAASLSISPTTGTPGCTPTLTLTGTNTLWTHETAAGLFTVSGGTGSSIATPTVTSDTSATAVLTCGSTNATETITDTSTTATATFTVSTPTTPTVTTGTLGTTQSTTVSVTSSSYTCTGSCSAVSSEGVCYSTINPPTSPCTSDGTASPFNSTLTGILPNTTYYIRAFAANSAGTAYGSVVSFTTRQVLYAGATSATGSTSSNNFTIAYTPAATNDAIWVYGYCHGATLPVSMAVTATGWTFTSRISPVSNGTAVAAMAVAIAPNTSAATLTVEFDSAVPAPVPCNSFYSVFVTEATGNDPTGGTTTFDAVGSSGASTGGCNQAGAAVTPTSANNLVWFSCVAATVSGVASPWIQGTADPTGNPSEYQSLAGGSGVGQAPSYVTTSGNYIVLGVAVSPTPAATGNPTRNGGKWNAGTVN